MCALLGYHLDYIYFIYGLSFITLAAVCFSFRKIGDRSLPWDWLCLFGLVHACNEWLDLIALSAGDMKLLFIARLCVLALSYIFLFEFARRGIRTIFNKKTSPWLYLPFLLGALSGWMWGLSGLNATIRYFLGLPAGVLSAWITYRSSWSRTKTAVCLSLVMLSVALGLYALATGLIVPPSPLIPACWLNYDSFLSFVGIPVQILRAVCAFFAAIAVFIYSQAMLKYESPLKWRLSRASIHVWTVFVLVLIVAAGWCVTGWVGDRMRADVMQDAAADVALMVSHLEQECTKVEQVTDVLKGSPVIKAWVSGHETVHGDVNAVLDRYRQGFDMTLCYILDKDGVCVFSSNRDDPDSLVGNSYAFRPYYTEPRAGRTGKLLALGVTHKKRGYYTGVPLYDAAGVFTGVAVVKKELEQLAGDLLRGDFTFFADPRGVIFLSSDRQFVFRCLWPITAAEAAAVRASKQFGELQLEPLFPRKMSGGGIVAFQGLHYYAVVKPVGAMGWSLVELSPLKPVFQVRFLCIVMTLFVCALVVTFFTALRQRESMLALVFSADNERKAILEAATQVGVITTDNSGLVTSFNPGAERMLGYTAGEVIGNKRLTDFHLPEEITARAKEAGAAGGICLTGFDLFAVYATQGVMGEREWTCVRKNGERLQVALSITPLRGRRGDVAGYLSIAADITALKLAEAALQEATAFQEATMNALTDVFYAIDLSGKYLKWNKSLTRVTGYSDAEISVMKPADFFAGEDVKRSARAIERVYKDGFAKVAANFITKDRRAIPYEFNGAVLKNAKGDVIGFSGIGRDVTERKKAEEALQKAFDDLKRMQAQLVQSEKMAAVGQLAAGMAHEINNPLAYVMGNIGAFNRYREKIEVFMAQLSEASLSAEQTEKIEALKKKLTIPYIMEDLPNLIKETYEGAERIKNIVQSLQIYAGGERGHLEDVDLVECLSISTDIVGSKLKNKIAVVKELGPVPNVKGYRTEIVHALTNLFLNAAEATGKGGTITIKTSVDGDRAVVEMTDTGGGIAPENLPKLFDPFFTTKPVGKGTGLGLPIVKGIIDRHNGTIEVKSEMGKGTTVIITLPAKMGTVPIF
jgi:PAS domain S-box-containing protein